MRMFITACCILYLGIVVGEMKVEKKLKENPITFFGGRIDGPIIEQFQGKMECAFVVGWDERKCRCHLTEDSWGHDKTFLVNMNEEMCKKIVK